MINKAEMVFPQFRLPGYTGRHHGDEVYNIKKRGDKGQHRRNGKGHSVQLSSIRTYSGPMTTPGMFLRPYNERMVKKSGNNNIHLKEFGNCQLFLRYTKDIFTTVADLSWPGTILLTFMVYLISWFIFAAFYYLFAIMHDNNHNVTVNGTDTDQYECITGVNDFVSAFLFSMESAKTIGYGSRVINTTCPHAIACLTLQWIVSAIFDTWVIGVCYIRIARPDARKKTTLFAKNAVICRRDGKRCLLIRVANLRKSLLLSVSVRARVITIREPSLHEECEGYNYMLEQQDLEFTNAYTTMLTAPIEYCHVIDKDSPLYSIPDSCFNVKKNWFEIVVVITGTIESTSLAMHMQASYLSSEVKNKHRFEQIVSRKEGRYHINFSNFHKTIPEPELYQYSNPSEEIIRYKTTQRFQPRLNEVFLEDEEDVPTGTSFHSERQLPLPTNCKDCYSK